MSVTAHVGFTPLLIGKLAGHGFGFTLDGADVGPIGGDRDDRGNRRIWRSRT